MKSASFNSPQAPPPVGYYPHARRVGHLLFLSGVGPRQPDKQSIPGVELDSRGKDHFLQHRSPMHQRLSQRQMHLGRGRIKLGQLGGHHGLFNQYAQ